MALVMAAVLIVLFSNFHIQVSYSGADGETHGCTIDLFMMLTLKEKKGILKTEFQQCGDVLETWRSCFVVVCPVVIFV